MKSPQGYWISWYLKIFSIISSDGHLVYGSGKILATLVGSQLGIIPVKSESHWLKGLGGDRI